MTARSHDLTQSARLSKADRTPAHGGASPDGMGASGPESPHSGAPHQAERDADGTHRPPGDGRKLRWLLIAFGIMLGTWLALAVVLVARAEAINRDQLPAMHQVAVGYFGPVACGEVVETFVKASTLQGEDAPLGAVARGGGCNTKLAAEFFDAASWGEACETVVHEYGHSLQDDWDPVAPDVQPHSPDRNSIMYADESVWPFAPCERADPTHSLEQRVYRAQTARWLTADKVYTARGKVRRLKSRHAQPTRVARARRQVRVLRRAWRVARDEFGVLATELRTYGVDV